MHDRSTSLIESALRVLSVSFALVAVSFAALADPAFTPEVLTEDGDTSGGGNASYAEEETRLWVTAEAAAYTTQAGVQNSDNAWAEDTVITGGTVTGATQVMFKVFVEGAASTYAEATYQGSPSWDWSAITGVGPFLDVTLNEGLQGEVTGEGFQDSVGVVMSSPTTFDDDDEYWNWSDTWTFDVLSTITIDFQLYGYVTVQTREAEGILFALAATSDDPDRAFIGRLEAYEYGEPPTLLEPEHHFGVRGE